MTRRPRSASACDSRSWAARASTLVAVAAFTLGCGQWEPETRARELAFQVLGCEEVELTRDGESQWDARGCGHEARIACTTIALEPTCIQIRRGGARAEEHWATSGGEDEGWEVPEEASDDFVSEDATDAELAAQARAAVDEDLDPDADEGLGDAPPPSTATIEATIRRGLDARRADVLACTGRTASVVRVRYETDGGLTITLAGDLEGSPEEGCVRAALSGVRVAPGASGTVLHLLRGAD